jgi:hypothetical protein
MEADGTEWSRPVAEICELLLGRQGGPAGQGARKRTLDECAGRDGPQVVALFDDRVAGRRQ